MYITESEFTTRWNTIVADGLTTDRLLTLAQWVHDHDDEEDWQTFFCRMYQVPEYVDFCLALDAAKVRLPWEEVK